MRTAARRRGDLVPLPLRRRIRRKLLAWYDRHRRDLPWRRRGDDPYAQWVAEVMLQQTRVETVRDYYDRFLCRFPDVTALARAKREDVLKSWEGLGYYRRALHLHQAARMLHKQRAPIPRTAAELTALPGVGAYTAAAMASISFGERIAAMDGNVTRVLARLFGISRDVRSAAGRNVIDKLASDLIPRGRPGAFNQAWMDLGTLVCTPRRPSCDACPLKSACVAFRTGRATALPRRADRRSRRRREVTMVVGAFVADGRLLVRRRRTGGLWSGLWEIPGTESRNSRGIRGDFERLLRECGVILAERPRKMGIVLRELTHRSVTFHVYAAAVRVNGRRPAMAGSVRWVTPAGFGKLSVSAAHRRIFDLVASQVRPARRGEITVRRGARIA